MRLLSICSGSSGNCIYMGSNNTHLLVDAGVSGKKIEAGLNKCDLTGNELSGILVTHEHTDHIASVGVLARRYNVPIYATKGTIKGIIESSSTGNIDENLFRIIKPKVGFEIGDISIYPQPISHDANEPVAYAAECNNSKAGVLTDLGCYDDELVGTFSNMNSLIIESNHDVNMLMVGRYPYPLKRRILGDKGHLSNESCGKLLCRLLNDGLSSIMLGHLSAENNLPELAYEAVRLEILMGQKEYNPKDFNLMVLKRSECSDIINI